jgi:CHAD domain-containing protein
MDEPSPRVAAHVRDPISDADQSSSEDRSGGAGPVGGAPASTHGSRRRGALATERVMAMIAAQRDELAHHETAVRLNADPKSVHKMRVAIRRLRAVLHAARPMLDRAWADELRDELSWLATHLAPVRDADVLIDHLQKEFVSLGPDAIHGRALLAVLESDRCSARDQLHEALDSDRYARLVEAVEQAARAPRTVHANVTLERMARREFRDVRKHQRRMGPLPSDAELHRLRIRLKRARYAAELVKPVRVKGASGKRVRKFLRCATALQTVLGEHQDAVVAEGAVREVAKGTNKTDASLVAGRLIEREHVRRARTRREFLPAWRKLERAGRKAWS